MTLTATDMFCGAGGSSLGAEDVPGVRLLLGLNHWRTAIDVHQQHFPHAGHDCADITAADPRRYPSTQLLLASPECTNQTAAKGVSRKKQNASFWDAPDPSAERSRATMWDVPRFAEVHRYDVIVTENVVDAKDWILWRAWHIAMEDLGYEHEVLSINSMHHGVPQSRDRIYVVFWRKGIRIDLSRTSTAWCTRCERVGACRQAWKNGRRVGKYRQQWVWVCSTCGTTCDPQARAAAEIIDWSLPCPRIAERRYKNGKLKPPLAPATRARILAGLQRYGWAPVVTAGAGNTYETTPGNRARPVGLPLATQQTTQTHALATAPGFLVQTAHAGDDACRIRGLDLPHPTVCADDDRHALVVPLRNNAHAQSAGKPVPTVAAGGNHHALLMRNNTARGDQGQMVTPTSEPARTMTTKGHQSLLMPYYSNGTARPASDGPVPTVSTKDRCALVDPEAIVDDCGFRMLEPHEVAAAMAFPTGYIPGDLSKKHQVRLAGNAVTPPVMAWIVGRIAEALRAA